MSAPTGVPSPSHRSVEGSVAIVTGGGTGLGAATASVLARAGARVVINGRREEKLAETAARIREEGGEVTPCPGDVSRPEDVRDLVERAVKEYGGVDVLVNNAGIHAHFRPAHEVPIDEFDHYLAINLRGPFLATKAVIPHLLARGGGSIVNVASMAGVVGLKYTVSYGAAKGGLVQMTRTVALDYADKGIRVNCICPAGMTPTENRDRLSPEEMRLAGEAVGGGAPVGGSASTEEVAQAILFLVGPHGRFITGAIIPIDGGYTAR